MLKDAFKHLIRLNVTVMSGCNVNTSVHVVVTYYIYNHDDDLCNSSQGIVAVH